VPRGRVGHAMASYGGAIYAVGGYNGPVLGDVVRYEPVTNWCESHVNSDTCLSTTACGYCEALPSESKAPLFGGPCLTLAGCTQRW
jgi:hypothetical protein